MPRYLQGAEEYNLWYGKFHGDHWDSKKGRDPAESRCSIAKDAGRTRADGNKDGSGKKRKTGYFCLHFARGMCAHGTSSARGPPAPRPRRPFRLLLP